MKFDINIYRYMLYLKLIYVVNKEFISENDISNPHNNPAKHLKVGSMSL